MKFERTLITAALPYANGPVHIGHLAGVYIPADIYTRFLRLRGEDVIFICGSDEHGVPVTIRASQEHITPQQVVDRYHNIIAKSFNEFGISFDIYSRTTSPIHHKFASDFFQHLHDKNIFIKKETEQFYDEQTHEFLTDRNIRGECPRCHAPNAYGDQCEKCGSALSPDELINPYNALNGNTLTKKKTSHWFLPLDKYQTWLEEWILQTHKDWRPNVYGQCKSWLDGGLNPRAVTRDLNWGIPVPVEGGKGKVLYVWFDAPLGYISNTIELCQQNPNKYGNWEKWWKDPQTRLIHFIGKDNIVFHCIVFPTMLKAAEDYILPDNVPANEFLNLEGDKISTSRNWAVWLNEYLVDFPDKQDTLRYVLTANAPETKDNDFTWKDFQARNNNELVAIYGNFVNRTLVLTERYCQNNVPENGIDSEYDIATWKEFVSTLVNVTTNLENFHFRDALKEAMNLARIGNKYLAETEPWKIAKTDMSRVHTILYNSLQMIANLCITFAPFLPYSSEKLQKILKIPALSWNLLSKKNLLQPGTTLEKAELLFDKIEDDVINNQIEKLTAIKKANESQNTNAWTPQPIKNEVSIEDFDKMDIRVATVLECSKVEKSNKLLRFVLQDGVGKRTILSGIAGSYSDPSVLIGKQVLYMANLPPRKMMGMESQGMILSALDKDGRLVLTTVSDKVQDGATVG